MNAQQDQVYSWESRTNDQDTKYSVEGGRVIVARDVRFVEEKSGYEVVMKREVQEGELGQEEWKAKTPYKELVGALQHLARYTRPDIQFAVSYIARYSDCFTKENWEEAKHILKYLKATKNMRLVYNRDAAKYGLYGCVDADWASDRSDRKSVLGYVFMYGGAAVSWASRKQQSVADLDSRG